MRFPFDAIKTAQAGAYLAKLNGGKINMLAVLKMLYLADRATLIETGKPITGDKFVNMDKGPVLSGLYDTMKGFEDETGSDPWFQYLEETEKYYFIAIKDETDALSEYEREVLEQIHDKFGSMHPLDIVRFTHTLPEYVDPHGSSIPLDPADVLRAASKSQEEIEEIASMAEEYYFLSLLGATS